MLSRQALMMEWYFHEKLVVGMVAWRIWKQLLCCNDVIGCFLYGDGISTRGQMTHIDSTNSKTGGGGRRKKRDESYAGTD